MDSGLISVRQTCQWLPQQGFIFRQPKTHRSAQPVTVAKGTVERLRQHRVRQLEDRLAAGLGHQDSDLIFANALGEPIHPNSLRDAWAKVAAEAGLQLRFHDLRHAHASLLLQQGVHPKIVSERLGHSGVGITLDTYSHALPGLQAEAAARLGDLLANG